jgi:hypothetical protein
MIFEIRPSGNFLSSGNLIVPLPALYEASSFSNASPPWGGIYRYVIFITREIDQVCLVKCESRYPVADNLFGIRCGLFNIHAKLFKGHLCAFGKTPDIFLNGFCFDSAIRY